MAPQLVPVFLKKALGLLEADPARPWTVREIASACRTGPRTLQRQFRHFVGQTPLEFLRRLRLDRARQALLRASGLASVTDIAAQCGFNHVGRFAAQYRKRYGETPSATLCRNRSALMGNAAPLPTLTMVVERPAIAVLPFDLIGPDADRAADLADEIAAALMRVRWIAVAVPASARYHLRGTVRDDGAGRLRIRVVLVDVPAGRYLWADRWDGNCNDLFELEERVATRIAAAIQPSVRDARSTEPGARMQRGSTPGS